MEFTGYLFVYFTCDQDDGEQIYFALSRDGLHWKDLNQGRPVLVSGIGEKGARDPFLIRVPEKMVESGVSHGQKYYLIATDLRIAAGKGWQAAQYEGSRDILVWESENLTDFDGPVAHTIGVEGAGCVWAPEAVYDEEQKTILLFWASMVKLAKDDAPKQRIYASYTKDFRTFSDPFLFLEKENHVIDSTIIKSGELYYRYTKDETTKNIYVDCSENLRPEGFREVKSEALTNLYGVEGPEIFRFNDREEWCLVVDRFAEGKGYLPLVTNCLEDGSFRILEEEAFDMGKTKKRHGGILNITEEEYQALERKFGR
ncbi:MAG: glycoside hydrolase family 43 protein [Candidatus Gastranaerophilales bacterium]|nr:glycoside hydrolase family 43 protein [Candidatus Gastranaerophilales bacterium]